MTGKDVEFFEVRISEGKDLRKKSVKPNIVCKMAAEILSLPFLERAKTFYNTGARRA